MDAADCTSFEHTLDALRALDVHALDDAAIRDSLVAAEQLRNAAEALQARLIVEMRDRAHRTDVLEGIDASAAVVVPTGAREEFVVDEIAAHLRCTRVAASHRFAVALAAHDHEALRRGWAEGRMDARKVQVVGDLLVDATPASAESLAAAAVAYAATHTAPQLRVWLGRRVIAADPSAAEQRRQRAMSGRCVTLVPLPDGVAELSACMPSLQARHVYDTLTALAHASDGDDARTLDQRRSDALYDLVTGRAEPPTVTLNLTVPAATLARGGAEPADIAGLGPISGKAVREALEPEINEPATADGRVDVRASRWRRLLTDPTSGILVDVSEVRYRPSRELDRAVRARDLTCRFPGCRRPATAARNGVDVDHTVPWPVGTTEAANLMCLCRHHHRLKHSPGWQVRLDRDGTVHWTAPTGHGFTTTPWQYSDPPTQVDEPPGLLDDAA